MTGGGDPTRLGGRSRVENLTPQERTALEQRLLAKRRGAVARTGIPRREPNGHTPLSFAQQRMWLIEQIDPGSAGYVIAHATLIEGDLDVSVLRRSFEELVRRHESLRTTFPVVDGEPAQMVLEAVPFELPVRRFEGTADESLGERVRLLVADELDHPFDLERGPVFRVTLLRADDGTHVLLILLHHIISDAWSGDLMKRELALLYDAFARGEPSPLPSPPLQYADFAVWQRTWLQGDELDRQMAYWKRQLDGVPALELPTDRPRPALPESRGGHETLVLPRRLSKAVSELCQTNEFTVYMVMLAALSLLLHRYSGQDEILIGSPVANRNRSELEGIIGVFVNMLVLRTDLAGDPTGREFLERVREAVLTAHEHQDVPFEKLVDELHPARDPSRNPFFQVAYEYRRVETNAPEPAGLRMRPIGFAVDVTRFDVEMHAWERGDDIGVQVVYRTDLFDASTIQRMLAHFSVLLEGLISIPDEPISRLELLDSAERRRILVDWNDTHRSFAEDRCIHQWFEMHAQRAPDTVALVFGDEELTYGALDRRANRLARELRARGVRPDSLVGICAERGFDMVVGILGILKAGGAYVPLDPGYPAERLAFMLADSGVSILLTQAHLEAGLPEHAAEVLCLDRDLPEGDPERDAQLPCATNPENLAYVIYTSGSTGTPKGAMLRHRGLCSLSEEQARAFGVGPGDRVLQFSSLSFDASTFEIVMALAKGATLYLDRRETLQPGPDLLRFLRQHAISIVTLPPSALAALPVEPLPDLKTITVAGEACSEELVSRWAPGRRFFNLYGPTEATIWSTMARLEVTGGSPHIGHPIGNTRVYVLDERMRPVPAGVPGELYIAGVGLARGYHRRPGLTAERFVPNPFGGTPGERLYRSGDLVRYRADGNVDFLGRIDLQVKLRGFRIELGEIEAVLVQSEQVREAVVLCRSDAPRQKRLVAYVVPDGDAEASRRDLREHVAGKLPEYMVPATFVFLDALPLTPNGKVDRAALPAPGEERQAEEAYVAPRTPAEQTLAGIWSELLRVDRVGVNDNFFELGGDSILSIQVIARAREAGLHLAARQMFQHQTVGELAAVAEEQSDRTVLAEQEPVVGEVPLTPIEHWFFEQELADAHHFNQSMLVSVRERLRGLVVEQAVEALLAHHDALRLRFKRSEAGWQQVNAEPGGEPPFECIDLSGLAEDEQSAAITAKAEAVQASLDLGDGPLMRVVHFDLGGARPDRLLIVIHHLAVDGVSWRILLEDLQRACAQVSRGEEVQLPAKTTSYRQWSERLAAHAESDEMLAGLAWWTDRPWEKAESLPVAGRVEQNTAGLSRSQTIELSEEETRALLQEVPRAYNTQIDDVLLTALVEAFVPWTGGERLLVDLEGHGREALFEDVDLSRTVGWFTAIYPVLLDGGDAGGEPGAALKSIKEQLRRVPNRGIGYGLLRHLCRDAASTAELAALPHPEVSFNYLGQFDQMVDERSMFGRAGESMGAGHSRRGLRAHLIDVIGAVAGGRLRMSFVWGSALHEEREIEALAERYRAALVGLIAHCTAPESGGCTPSDFPLATVNQRMLDELVAEYGPREIEDLYPLSPMQLGMMYHSASEPTSGVYVQQMRFDVDGLDVETFKRSWDEVVARHTVLRTSLVGVGSEAPLQLVHRHVELPVTEHDLRELTEDEQAAWLETLLDEDRARGFDLDQSPLMRLSIIRRGEARCEFVWTFHHVVLDGWSFPRVINEVFAVYGARRRNEEPALPRLHRYGEYIAWLQDQDAEEAQSFWQRTLGGFATPTRLGETLGKIDAARTTERYDHEMRSLPAELTESLQRLASRHQVTMNTLVAGAWSLLLSRYSGESDVVFGTVVSGRPADLGGVESMVGMFVNTLPLRVRIPDDQVLGEWLQDLQAHQSELRQYEYSPLWQVQHKADLPAGTPLFDSLFVFENYPIDVSAVQASDLKISLTPPVERTGYPLMLTAILTSHLGFKLTYDCDRFDVESIRGLLDHLQMLLEGMTEAPETTLGTVPMLGEAERCRLLVEWNDTAVDLDADQCLHTLFERQVERTPERVALVDGERTMTYGALDARANELADGLRSLGVGPEVPVGLFLDRGSDMVAAVLAVLKSGGFYVPLAPDHPRERIRFMLEDAGAPVLIAVRELVPDLEAAFGASLGKDGLSVLCPDDDRMPASGRRAGARPAVRPDHAAYLIYTSGSTGVPKGVQVTHRNVVNFLESMRRTPGFDAGDSLLAVTTLSFDIAGLELFLPLLAGARVVIASSEEASYADSLQRLLQEAGITVMQATPATWRMLVQTGWRGDPKLKVLCGGEALPRPLADALLERSGELWNMYGPTETTIWSSVARVGRERGSVTIGSPIANTTLYVLDANLEPVPIGVAGELFIGGEGVARGYLNRPGLTATKFVPDPFGGELGARLYRTGDLCRRRRDGSLEFLGRIDHQVKVRGFRIELGEIESVLAGHPAVAQAIVALWEQEPGDQRLLAYVVGQEGPPSQASLREHLQAELPEYMVPARFVFLESMPLTPNGKVDRKTLPAPDADRYLESAIVAPESETEIALASIWEDLLGVDGVSVFDNFFELGGHSLMLVQVVTRIRESTGVHLMPVDLILQSTLRQLAGLHDERLAELRGTTSDHGGNAGKPTLRRRLVTAVQRLLLPGRG